jgi:RHS repeat-associated protein
MKTQGQTFYYHYNPHGDVIAMTDSTGKVVAQYTYDAWGNVLTSSAEGLAADNPFGYAGYMYDKEIGMYYLMARYYHPVHGVFISVDPDPGDADDPITQNGYTYADNNPVMLADLDGERPQRIRGERGEAAFEFGSTLYRILKKDPAYMPSKVHGNSKSSKKRQHGYEIYNIKTGDVVKVGISGRRLNKNGTSPRANQQVRKWNKGRKVPLYGARIVIKNIPNRKLALNWERNWTYKRDREGNSLRLHTNPVPKSRRR